MTTFSKIWDTEVKALAKACVTEPKLVRLLSQSKGYKFSKEEKEFLASMSGKYKDPYGMYYIAPSYFQNLFLSDESNEEWKNRAALRDGLYKLMSA